MSYIPSLLLYSLNLLRAQILVNLPALDHSAALNKPQSYLFSDVCSDTMLPVLQEMLGFYRKIVINPWEEFTSVVQKCGYDSKEAIRHQV